MKKKGPMRNVVSGKPHLIGIMRKDFARFNMELETH